MITTEYFNQQFDDYMLRDSLYELCKYDADTTHYQRYNALLQDRIANMTIDSVRYALDQIKECNK